MVLSNISLSLLLSIIILFAIPFPFNSYIRVIVKGFIRRILNYYKERIFNSFTALNIKVLDNLIGYIFNRIILRITINFKRKDLNLIKIIIYNIFSIK